jgi:hypothetical protein
LRLALVTTVAVALLAAGCASADRSAGGRFLRQQSFDEGRAYFEQRAMAEPEDAALEHNEAGVMALLAGDVPAAKRHFRIAYDDLEDLTATAGDTFSTFLGSAESRHWKGEPYERCMNAYYLGLTYWLGGDDDNAAAAFKTGVLRDADSATGETQSDFALLWFLMGQAQRSAFHSDRGQGALARAHALRPDNPWTAPEKSSAGNVLLVLETGTGPQRVPTGPHGSEVRFRRQAGVSAGAIVRLGERVVGRTAPIGDIYRQATTRGEKVIDRISGGKAVFKDAAVIGGAIVLDNSGSTSSDVVGVALIAAGLLASAQTDMRYWATMPDDVHVLLAELDVGHHVLELQGVTTSGRPIADMVWEVPVVVGRSGVSLVWTRALPGGQHGVVSEN